MPLRVCFNQSSSHQQTLGDARGAVAVHEDRWVAGAVTAHDPRVLPRQIEGFHQPGRPGIFDEQAADDAWRRTLAWLDRFLTPAA